MKKYVVNVNGTKYEVEIEEIEPSQVSVATPVAEETKATASAEGTTISAPMPGNIFDVKVNVGQEVNEGDVLVILEAMKMENEIMAPCSGTVTAISCQKGTSVDTGATLVVIG